MPRATDYFPSYRRNERRERQVREIGERIGAGVEFASVIDYALAFTLQRLAGGNSVDESLVNRVPDPDQE